MSAHAVQRLLPVTLLLLAGCASTGPSSCPVSSAPTSSWVGSAELRQAQVADLYEALRVTRPRFLRPRAARSPEPVVYMDGVRVTELDALRAVGVPDVVGVQFMSGPDATTRFGTDHVGGALLVRTVNGVALDRCGR